MVKKILKAMSLCMVAVLSCLMFTACGSPKVTNFSTEGVSSNGKIGAIKDGYIYYIKKVTSDRTLTGDACIPMGIYKSAVDDKCNLTGESTLVYSALAGFSDGEIYVFGDYIYFLTPAQVTSSEATKLTKRASFCRVGIDGKNYKVLYVTETEESPTYSFYKFNNELFLIVFENKNLYSVNMATLKTKTLAEEVESVALSKTCGEGENADKKIFYSKTPDEEFVTQTGQNIYSVNPDGSEEFIISAGKDVTLKEIQNGYLYYVVDSNLYRTTASAGLSTETTIYYGVPSSYYILSDGSVLVKDTTNSAFTKTSWINHGEEPDYVTVLASTDYDFLFEYEGYLYFKYTKSGQTQTISRISLSLDGAKLTKVTEDTAVKAGTIINWEVIGSTLYYYIEETVTDDAGKSIKYSVLKTVGI